LELDLLFANTYLKTLQHIQMSELINRIDETFNFNEQTMRVVGDSNEPWFVARDICNILELSNITDALKHIPEAWRGCMKLNTFGGVQDMITINEAGLYKLIMRSKKPIAEKFQHVVCSEILPTLRKKGEYKIQSIIDNCKKLEEENQKLEEENIKIKEQKRLLELKTCRLMPRVQYKDRNVIYIITSKFHLQTRTYMIGKAVNLTDRVSSYNRTMDHEVVYYKACNNACQMRVVELMVLMILDRYREVKCRDRFTLPEGKDLTVFTKPIEDVINLLKDVGDTVDIEDYTGEEKIEIQNENNLLRYNDGKEYTLAQRQNFREEHKEEIAARAKKYYEENKDMYQLKEQISRECNKESISKREKIYREENKEELDLKARIYYLNNKEQIKEERKKYQEANKDEISKKGKIKGTCECGAAVRASGLTRHRKTVAHKLAMLRKMATIQDSDDSESDASELSDDDETVCLGSNEIEQTDSDIVLESDFPQTQVATPSTIEVIVGEAIAKRKRTKEMVVCECGLKIIKHALDRHRKAKIHENSMKLLATKSNSTV